MGCKYCHLKRLMGELLMQHQNCSDKKKKKMLVDFLLSSLQVSHLLNSWDLNKINELLSLWTNQKHLILQNLSVTSDLAVSKGTPINFRVQIISFGKRNRKVELQDILDYQKQKDIDWAVFLDLLLRELITVLWECCGKIRQAWCSFSSWCGYPVSTRH